MRTQTLRFGKALAGRGRMLRDDRQGVAMPIMAAGMMLSICSIGAAFDLTRIYVVRNQMQSGADAAALAGARAFGVTDTSDSGRERQVAIYFAENFPTRYLGTAPVVPVPHFETVDSINKTRVTASVQVPMSFMGLFGAEPKTVSVTAIAEMQPKPIEVMVVLDDTGSMQTKDVGGGTRMQALQAAMLDFNNVLHQGAASRAELAMGFVTYNVTTNVGAILQKYGVGVRPTDGYTNVGLYSGVGSSITTNALGWRGCVENDDTIVDVNDTASNFPRGAWDVTRSLPGERNEFNDVHPSIRPYLYPPNANTISYTAVVSGKNQSRTDQYQSTYAATADHYVPAHLQSNTTDSRTNNFYLLGPNSDMAIGQRLANTVAYRQHFYSFYIGLNFDATKPEDDVIVRDSDGGYYTPGSAVAWKVNYSRIPGLTDTRYWAAANSNFGYPTASAGLIDYPGGSKTRANATLKMPSPNFQCPEPSMDVQYGRPKSAYDDYVNKENYAVMPASGTLHHIGFLWGYRLLTRSDVFTRTNPIPNEQPLRALVFMTDGETSVGSAANWYGAYGALREKRISSNATNTTTMRNQIMRRFSKVCEAAKREGIAVYIVSLIQSEPEFKTCALERYYHTTDKDTIKRAFNEIAVDLVDLHLSK